jgi:hypothetical protein
VEAFAATVAPPVIDFHSGKSQIAKQKKTYFCCYAPAGEEEGLKSVPIS